MDIRQLRCFLTVADEGTVSAAARRLGIAQPPLSVQIRRLESSLGVRLFDRNPRSTSLTAAGRQLLPEARAIVLRTENAAAAVQDRAAGRLGSVRVAVRSEARSKKLTKRLRSFVGKHRSLRVVVNLISDAHPLPPWDILVSASPEDRAMGHSTLFESQPLGLAFQQEHRLCGRSTIVAVDLAGELILLQSAGRRSAFDTAIRSSLPGDHYRFDVPVSDRSVDACLWLVSIGLGISVCGEQSVRDGPARIRWRPVDPALPTSESFVIANPSSEAAILPTLTDFLCR